MNRDSFIEVVKAAHGGAELLAEKLIDGADVSMLQAEVLLVQPREPFPNKEIEEKWLRSCHRVGRAIKKHVLLVPYELKVLNAEDLK